MLTLRSFNSATSPASVLQLRVLWENYNERRIVKLLPSQRIYLLVLTTLREPRKKSVLLVNTHDARNKNSLNVRFPAGNL
jgi:hypothetical protein